MAAPREVAPSVLLALARLPDEVLLVLSDDPRYAIVLSQNRQALSDPVFAKLWALWNSGLKEDFRLKHTVARPLSPFQRHLVLTSRNISVPTSDLLEPMLSYNVLDADELALVTEQNYQDSISDVLFAHYQHRYDILGPLLPHLTGNSLIAATLRAPVTIVSDSAMIDFVATAFADTSTVLTPTKTLHAESLRFLVETRPHLVPALLRGPQSMVVRTAIAESPIIGDPAILSVLIPDPEGPVLSYIRDAIVVNPVVPLGLRRRLALTSPHDKVTRLAKVYDFVLPTNYADVTNPSHIAQLVKELTATRSAPSNAWRLLELLRSPVITPEQCFTIMAYLIQPPVRDCVGYQRAVSAQRELLERHRYHSIFHDYQVLSQTPPDPELRRPARPGSLVTDTTTIAKVIEAILPFDARPLANVLGTSRYAWMKFFTLLEHVDLDTAILKVASTVHRLSQPVLT